MVRLDEELIRKRSEHNEGEISTLEEISLHQENIDKIELLGNWCRDLKILLLQSNLIAKIENVSKLKKLQYLNLALNNIEKIENLNGCESLQKLDLTLNFIGELTSVRSLISNIHLEILYLTGNPSSDFKNYRTFVIATLPQLKYLDGLEIERSDKILAAQDYNGIENTILLQEQEYSVKRLTQKKAAMQKIEEEEKIRELPDKPEEERLKEFWSELCDHSPETRVQIANQILKQQEEKERKDEDLSKPPKRIYKQFNSDGRPLNVNEAKIPFIISEDEESNTFVLDISVYKYLDTSLLDVDIHPTHVKILIKGKMLQIVLAEEISTELSKVQRSQTTGHLVLTMPKVKGEVKLNPMQSIQHRKKNTDTEITENGIRRELLEIGRSDDMDFSNIVKKKESINKTKVSRKYEEKIHEEREKLPSLNFIDNPDVPPLE